MRHMERKYQHYSLLASTDQACSREGGGKRSTVVVSTLCSKYLGCVYVCVGTCSRVQLSEESREECIRSPRAGRCKLSDLGAGNPAWVLWESSKNS